MTERADSCSNHAVDVAARSGFKETATPLSFTDHPRSAHDRVPRVVIDTIENAHTMSEAAVKGGDVTSVCASTIECVVTHFLLDAMKLADVKSGRLFVVRQAAAGWELVTRYDETESIPTPDAGVSNPQSGDQIAQFAEHRIPSAAVIDTDDAKTQAEVTVTDSPGSEVWLPSLMTSREQFRMGFNRCHDNTGKQIDGVESLLQTDESIHALYNALTQDNT